MKLHEIIKQNEIATNSVLIELLIPYKRSLQIYFQNEFCTDDLILMVTSVSNAAQYGKIVSGNDFYDAICEYMGVDYIDFENTESDDFIEFETICSNSLPLNKL